jgi:phosphoribosylanthranilate isomerase
LLPESSIIQTVHWDLSGNPPYRDVVKQLDEIAGYAPGRRVLADAKVNGASGGTGLSFNWKDAAEVLSRYRAAGLWMIVAGGLRPENVAEAIRTMRPWGVDVASGVESEPGKKDRAKLKAFLENARRA